VNPNDGPGNGSVPGDQYYAAIKLLSSYPNIQLLGYVRTGYATRNINDVIQDVFTYSGWSSNSSSLAMHGIFLDETPHEYTANAVEFMRKVNKVVKEASGLRGVRTVCQPHAPLSFPHH
jgi:hypothetical protein